jgi:3-methyladenine DNA glycosylase AlkD
MDLPALRDALAAVAVPADAAPMAAYVKDQFVYFGIKAGPRRTAAKPILRASGSTTADQLVDFAEQCWNQPEREFQYVAMDVLRKRCSTLRPGDLPSIEALIVSKSWWDTVDGLAAWVVGPMVSAYPQLIGTLDSWAADKNVWRVRSALLHQLSYKEHTDVERLFRWCDTWAEHPDFFIRKAIGWALRQYARTDPDAVLAFVATHEGRLSPLSKREATRRL